VAYIQPDMRARFGIDTANLTLGPKTWVERPNPFGFQAQLPQMWVEETAYGFLL